MKHRPLAILVLALFALVGSVQAQNRPDPNGVWKWTVEFNGNSFEQTLNLKLDGDKLTGFMLGRNNQEMPISEGTYKDGAIAFKLTRTGGNGQTFTSVYTGTVSGDNIQGKTESNFNGQTRSRDWQAKREKA